MKRNLLYFILVFLFGTSLTIWYLYYNSPKIADGGPCTYASTFYPATVIAIDTIDANNYDLQFEVDYDGMQDTFYYGHNSEQFVSKTTLDSSHCHIGKVYQYEHKHLVKGSCNPDIFRLKLEK